MLFRHAGTSYFQRPRLADDDPALHQLCYRLSTVEADEPWLFSFPFLFNRSFGETRKRDKIPRDLLAGSNLTFFNIQNPIKLVEIVSSNRALSRFALGDNSTCFLAMLALQVYFPATLVNIEPKRFIAQCREEIPHQTSKQVSPPIGV